MPPPLPTPAPTSSSSAVWAIAERVAAEAKPLVVPSAPRPGQLRHFSAITPAIGQHTGIVDLGRTGEVARLVSAAAGLVQDATAASAVADRAAGALTGLALGDSVGAPLEFIPATSQRVGPGRPHLAPTTTVDATGAAWLEYYDPYNKFELRQGQWTDDASMSLCLADSLLCQPNGAYNGSDCRVRFWLWWSEGLNNAFRFDKRPGLTSVGLGGNIANSLYQLEARYAGRPASEVPAVFSRTGNEAGNGSIMRLAPVPIRFAHDPMEAARVAVESSLATHPGADAAAACAFLAYATARLITRAPPSAAATGDAAAASPSLLLESIVADFIASPLVTAPCEVTAPAIPTLLALLHSAPPSSTEACWDWRSRPDGTSSSSSIIAVDATLAARGSTYNGHPNSAGYFGSYCMDALAMALWSVHGSTCFADAIWRCVNLLGDADSTAAVAGQLAGAIYGHRAIPAATEAEKTAATIRAKMNPSSAAAEPGPTIGATMLANLARWDRFYEIPLRALMLSEHSMRQRAAAPAE